MPVTTMRELLEAGVHFGHRTPRWNPKMQRYIFGARNGIHIINLQHTVRALERVTAYLRALASRGGEVIFVGTKRQAQEVVREEALRCGQYYVEHRWLGGTLTNYDTLKTRLQRLRELSARQQAGEFERLPKKEAQAYAVEIARLEKRMGGIRNLSRLPGALYVIDPRRERNAVAEARRLGIPVIAMMDTNCDPDVVNFGVPANDDAIRSIRTVTAIIADALLGGREEHEKREAERAVQTAREAEAALAAAAAKAAEEQASTAEVEAAMLAAAQDVAEKAPAAPLPAPQPASSSPQHARRVTPRGGRRAPAGRRTGRKASTGPDDAKSDGAQPAAEEKSQPSADPAPSAPSEESTNG